MPRLEYWPSLAARHCSHAKAGGPALSFVLNCLGSFSRQAQSKRGKGSYMRRLIVLVAALAATAALAAGLASSAGAYGGGSSHDTWQVAQSFNCDNPSFCGDDLGGFWGWVEFDRYADGSITGDGEFAGCGHSVGGGGPGS